MSVIEKLNVIREVLHTEYPDTNIYVDDITAGFKRPSFYVHSSKSTVNQIASNIFEEDTTFQIVYFSERNQSGNTSKMKLYEKSDEILKLLISPDRIRDYKTIGFNSEIVEGDLYIDFNMRSYSSRKEEELPLISEVIFEM